MLGIVVGVSLSFSAGEFLERMAKVAHRGRRKLFGGGWLEIKRRT